MTDFPILEPSTTLTGTAFTPVCAIHGPMKYREAGEWWVCPGYDGEGCIALPAESIPADSVTPVMVYAPSVTSPVSRWGYRMAVPVEGSSE